MKLITILLLFVLSQMQFLDNQCKFLHHNIYYPYYKHHHDDRHYYSQNCHHLHHHYYYARHFCVYPVH